MKTQKAKIGDTIKSFDFEGQCGSYFIGIVTKVEVDEKDGCEYVYFTATTRVKRIVTEHRDIEAVVKELRVVQNGHKKMMDDDFTDFIQVVK